MRGRVPACAGRREGAFTARAPRALHADSHAATFLFYELHTSQRMPCRTLTIKV